LGRGRIKKRIDTYRRSKGIREIIRLNDSLSIRGEPNAVDLLSAEIVEESLEAYEKVVFRYLDIPHDVCKFVIGTKGANIKNYQSMEGIKTVHLKDDRLRIGGERDAVDLIMAVVLNLVEKASERLQREAQKDLQKNFGKVDKEEFLPEKEAFDHYAIKQVGRNIDREKDRIRNI
jgi:hypothetical protein